jgi:hypothetical protein
MTPIGLTPEQIAWLAKHERLHSEHLERQQQFNLATKHITNEDLIEENDDGSDD